MNDRLQQVVSVGTALRSLARDRVLQASLAVYVAAFIALALAPTGLGGPAEAAQYMVDPVLLGLTVVALLIGRSRLVPSERRFWDLLALAWTFWLLVELIFFFGLETPIVSASFLTDALYISYYLVFALTVDLRPHLSASRTLTALGRRLESMAGLTAIFGLLLYFAIVVLPEPLGLSLSFGSRDQGLTPFLLIRVSLDVLILGRLVFAAVSARGRWRSLYALLAGGMLGYALRDAISLLRYEQILPAASGLADQAFLYLPGFVILLAARYRHVPTVEVESLSSESAARHLEELGRPSPIALYALLVPGLHFLLYPLGFLDVASRTPREIFCLIYVFVLGTMAWIHQTLLAEDNQSARDALRQAEERLSRSRKLEAVGRLAGGIAHDFNNYLTVIQGYSELLKGRLRGAQEQSDLDQVEDAARKATHLTRQLLAFGRRQVLRPEALDLNAVVRDTSKMLGSLLGEDVTLEVALDPDVGLALADLGQTEQVLVNLAINGRDAMPGGGTLSIRTRRISLGPVDAQSLEIPPGAYVSLEVADTGVGMSEEVRSQAFEPFFTTKEHGRGTGLGLSTVYGVVTQSGGAIDVSSAPRRGTAVRVLLPSAETQAMVEATPGPRPLREPISASVVLVEDEDAVRHLASRALSQAGFSVRTASHGAEAVTRFLDDCESIDLLITDVLMPEMDGVELAAAFQARCPELRILFLSGYPADTLRERQKILPQSLRLLEKPFSPTALVEVVHEVLEDSFPTARIAGPGSERVP